MNQPTPESKNLIVDAAGERSWRRRQYVCPTEEPHPTRRVSHLKGRLYAAWQYRCNKNTTTAKRP